VSSDRIYDLLPAVYRSRDVELGEPLRALLQVIGEQVDALEGDIARLYENWFIETCDDWAVPYIGDLVGYRSAQPLGEAGSDRSVEALRRNRVMFPRAGVANAIRSRRRRGTLALLEELAGDLGGWPARAVEYYALLAGTQSLKHVRGDRARSADMRSGDALARLGGPFEELAHLMEMPRPTSPRRRGRFAIPDVGVWAWRMRAYSLTRAPAFCIDRASNHYTFSVLGNDVPLVTRPEPEPAALHVAGELSVPAAIARRALETRLLDLYGEHASLCIWRDSLAEPVHAAEIVAADLSEWAYRPRRDQVAVDPVLGRIAFSARNAPDEGVWVTWHYGFPDELGGGEYPRTLRPPGARALYRVGPEEPHARIVDAVAHWRQDLAATDGADERPLDAVVEIVDSGTYAELLDIELEPGQRLEIRAADGARPVVRLLDWGSNRPDQLRVRGIEPAAKSDQAGHGADDGCPAPLPRLVLDGLVISGRSVELRGPLGEVTIRHCTLVPGWALDEDCCPLRGEEPSLELDDTSACVTIERSILGSIRVNANEVATDPVSISLEDSILDATSPELGAVYAPDGLFAHAILRIVRTTVLGELHVHAIELAEDSILRDVVRVARRQLGCMRFCFVPPGSRTPRRYDCQPDLVIAAVRERVSAGDLAAADAERVERRETRRVAPRFESVRYGTPPYARLSQRCADELRRGAHDESEMGVYHDLFEPQRSDAVRAALSDYVPAGMEAGLFFAT
jgi:hypothetical protein